MRHSSHASVPPHRSQNVTAQGFRILKSSVLGPLRGHRQHAHAHEVPRATAPAANDLEILRLNPDIIAAGGLKVADQPPAQVQSLYSMLANNFMAVNLEYPGVHLLNIDPPIMTVKDFMPADDCDAFIAAARNSGAMKSSRVGGQGSNAKPDIRTSTTLAMTSDIVSKHRDVAQQLHGLLTKAVELLKLAPSLAEEGKVFSRPNPGELTFELPQVAHYLPGEHFLSHEDAFPASTALEKGYQRRATLLVYLNDVPRGGATYFDHLQMGVQPKRGDALVFFPSFAGGRPDSRTLHTAEDAIDEKWMTQLWVSGGLRPKPAPSPPTLPPVSQFASPKKGKAKRKKK